MRVEVEFTAHARAMLVRWLARRMPNPDDAYPLAAVYVRLDWDEDKREELTPMTLTRSRPCMWKPPPEY